MNRDLITKILRFFKLVTLEEYSKLNSEYFNLKHERDFYANMCIIDGDKIIKKAEQVYQVHLSSAETASVSVEQKGEEDSVTDSIVLNVNVSPLPNRGPFTTIYLTDQAEGNKND